MVPDGGYVFPRPGQALLLSYSCVFFCITLHRQPLLVVQNSHPRRDLPSVLHAFWLESCCLSSEGWYSIYLSPDFYPRNLRASTVGFRFDCFLNLDQIEFGGNMKGMISIKESNTFLCRHKLIVEISAFRRCWCRSQDIRSISVQSLRDFSFCTSMAWKGLSGVTYVLSISGVRYI